MAKEPVIKLEGDVTDSSDFVYNELYDYKDKEYNKKAATSYTHTGEDHSDTIMGDTEILKLRESSSSIFNDKVNTDSPNAGSVSTSEKFKYNGGILDIASTGNLSKSFSSYDNTTKPLSIRDN
jgi:hypothetical protein